MSDSPQNEQPRPTFWDGSITIDEAVENARYNFAQLPTLDDFAAALRAFAISTGRWLDEPDPDRE